MTVDRNITSAYVDDMVEEKNASLRHLTSIGAILGGRCWADPAANPAAEVAQRKASLELELTLACPVERITFRSRLVNDCIDEICARPVSAA
jgi:phage tail sheath protein FI